MKLKVRKILFGPFSLIYGVITTVRNWLFDENILSSKSFDIPIISVGNLAVGGTGKTPHVEFILSFIASEFTAAVLSRGYKRKTKGFVLADKNSTYTHIGDESFQVFSKNPDLIVAVDERRVHGVSLLLNNFPDLQVIILDDAYQHRQIKPGLSIVLSDMSSLYINDSHLPGGNLRERKKGIQRADIIIITKCPINLLPIEKRILEKNIVLKPYQSLFFSSFEYSDIYPIFPEKIIEKWNLEKIAKWDVSILLITGIVSPWGIFEQLKKHTKNVEKIFYPDHYNFQKSDFSKIESVFSALKSQFNLIIVTEKDASRIITHPSFPISLMPYIHVLPIKVKILNNEEELFKQKLIHYVRENSRNSQLYKK